MNAFAQLLGQFRAVAAQLGDGYIASLELVFLPGRQQITQAIFGHERVRTMPSWSAAALHNDYLLQGARAVLPVLLGCLTN